MLDDRLSLSITTPDGLVHRWGPNEPDGSDVPMDLTLSTTVPGGFKDLTCSLLRDLNPRPDEGLYYGVRAYGAGNQTAWEGRVGQLPRDNSSLRPGAVGWSAHLLDDKSFRSLIVDRDPTRWGETSLVRKRGLAAFGISQADIQWSTDPAAMSLPYPAQPLPAWCSSELLYDGAGLPLVAVQYQGEHTGFPAGYTTTLAATDDDITYDVYALTFDNTLRTVNLTTPRRRLLLIVNSNGNAVTPAAGAVTLVSEIAVYGATGIPRTTNAGQPDGFIVSDSLPVLLAAAAPLLTFTTGTDGSIQPTSFVVPHATFPDPTSLADIVAKLNAYHCWEWAVWEAKRFTFRPPDRDSKVWEASLAAGAHISKEGDSGDAVINGIVVRFTDPEGVQRIVGPPGYLGADLTDTALQDLTDLNPVNKAAIPRRWDMIELSLTTTLAAALQIGRVYLAEFLLATRRGELVLTGPQRLRGQLAAHPVWAVRAGDAVTIVDRPNEPVRRIIETTYTHASRSTTCALDNTAQKAEAILERMGAQLIGRVA